MNPKRTLLSGLGLLLITLSVGVSCNAQAFELKPAAPSRDASTWVDILQVTYDLQLDVSQELKLGNRTVETQRSGLAFVRSIRVVADEGQGKVTLEVAYVPLPANMLIRGIPEIPPPVTAPLEGRKFTINCADMSITDQSDPSLPPLSTEDTKIVERECREVSRNGTRAKIFSNSRIGDAMNLPAGSEIAMLSEDLTELGLGSTVISLEQVELESHEATFAVRSNVRSAGDLGKLFDSCNGKLNVEARGLLTRLELTCPVKDWSPTAPTGPDVKMRGEMKVVFVRKILGP